MTYNTANFLDVVNKFRSSRNWVNDIEVEIDGDVNELAPLDMVRTYEGELNIDTLSVLATQMVLNKEVRFKHGGQQVFSFVYKGGDLGAQFKEHPYLIDVLLKTCYGILLKKLTPPFAASETKG